MYDIQSKSDFKVGATLIVSIPQDELDQKALYTVLAEKPDFILPFSHRAIDGKIEFTYQVGNRSKIIYLSGKRSPREYADLWSGILQPLLDCGDWFMNPYSFVLDPEYLYCDKNSNAVSFVYIPSVKMSSDYAAMKNMVMEIVKQNHVTDITLENKVLWAIQDFNPNEFLQMVKSTGASKPAKVEKQQAGKNIQPIFQPATPASIPAPKSAPIPMTPKSVNEPKTAANNIDDIAISFPADGKVPKKEKKVKTKTKTKPKKSFWGKKKIKEEEIVLGAAAEPIKPKADYVQPVVPVYTQPEEIDYDATQLEMDESRATHLRYVGNGGHPNAIDVNIATNSVFTIGRFDVSVGTKQCDFEFDKKTKAVTRRHAAIEHNENGYSITDLASSAGTFLDGQKLPPNAPFKLENGSRVSFGHSGADYIWEE